ncbi:MAG: hypothetical protein ACJA2S_002899 [Cyclobacteriaceae bacterium]|jgi:hypothetical protein
MKTGLYELIKRLLLEIITRTRRPVSFKPANEKLTITFENFN